REAMLGSARVWRNRHEIINLAPRNETDSLTRRVSAREPRRQAPHRAWGSSGGHCLERAVRVRQGRGEDNSGMGGVSRMPRPRSGSRKFVAPKLATAAVALSLLLAGCFSETYQKGYIVPDGALEQIPIGSTQEQVLIVLGTPSTVATVSGEAFYYISQR